MNFYNHSTCESNQYTFTNLDDAKHQLEEQGQLSGPRWQYMRKTEKAGFVRESWLGAFLELYESLQQQCSVRWNPSQQTRLWQYQDLDEGHSTKEHIGAETEKSDKIFEMTAHQQ